MDMVKKPLVKGKAFPPKKKVKKAMAPDPSAERAQRVAAFEKANGDAAL